MPNYDDGKELKCSFCGKPQSRVRKLIAGPNVYICDECIGVCTSILEPCTRKARAPADAAGAEKGAR